MHQQVMPHIGPLPLTLGQHLLLALSSLLLAGSAVVLSVYVPRLPARLPMHWNGMNTPNGSGPASDLWSLWVLMLVVWAIFAGLSCLLSRGGFPLNGLPPITEKNAPFMASTIRTMVLFFQLVVMLVFSTLMLVTIVFNLGGPNLSGLPMIFVAGFPLGIGYFLYRSSFMSERLNR